GFNLPFPAISNRLESEKETPAQSLRTLFTDDYGRDDDEKDYRLDVAQKSTSGDRIPEEQCTLTNSSASITTSASGWPPTTAGTIAS
ncbi:MULTISPECIES: hypothetical protein, partial [unclassified Bradyrhizobium]|uniref:hypothetical protein n=1 Tax=unclassified Bradyrhizobium TaxID=2631580 RepID=UPI0033957C6E